MKFTLSLIVIALATSYSVTAYSYDSLTASQTIKSHVSQLEGNAIYLSSVEGSWSATSTDGTNTSCGNQHTVYIPKDVNASGYDEMFASVLAAANNGKQVSFYGFCDTPSAGYFKGTHVNVNY